MKNLDSPHAGRPNKQRKPRRWWKLLQWAALIAFCLLALLAVALLWKPAAAARHAPTGDFADVLLQTGLVSASVETPVYGSSNLTVSDKQIADVVAGDSAIEVTENGDLFHSMLAFLLSFCCSA